MLHRSDTFVSLKVLWVLASLEPALNTLLRDVKSRVNLRSKECLHLDEPGTDNPAVPTSTTNGQEPPSLDDHPPESDDADDWQDENDDDDEILDVLIADVMI